VPRHRRERRARTHDWQAIQQQTLWPEQEAYERLRPIVLFGETAASRAKETGVNERTLHYQADRFERYGMVSLFPKVTAPLPDPGQRLPPELRQLIVDLKAEHPAFRPHEIARICYVRDAAQAFRPYRQADSGRGTSTQQNHTALSALRPDRRSVTFAGEPLSICTRKAGRIPTLPTTSRRLATGCMRCSNARPGSAMRDSMIFRSSTRAHREESSRLDRRCQRRVRSLLVGQPAAAARAGPPEQSHSSAHSPPPRPPGHARWQSRPESSRGCP
jgi:hypothetical protein